jgi:RimJ/RimL family protein N-acetyltransferase
VASDTTVELVDPEHDRFEWLPGAEALRRVLPRLVAAAQFQRVEHIPNATLSFRPLTYDDMPNVVRWQSQPHVARWWHREVTTVAEALDRYGPSLTGQEPTRSWVVTLDGRDVGYLQDYRVGDYEEYASATGFTDAVGFDYLIGEPQLTGRGLGTRMIWEFLRDVVAPAYPDAPTFLASPDPDNATSLRALAKCGFAIGPCVGVRDEGKITREVVCTLDRRHWFGPSSVPG